MAFRIEPSQIRGILSIPSSKSHTVRAILFGAFASGVSTVENFLPSPDAFAMIEAVKQLGAEVQISGNTLSISGFAGNPKIPDDVIDCGNSGLVLRFIGALAALSPGYTILTGDNSIRHNRPIKPLLDGLKQLGAFAESSRGDDLAPIVIKGPLKTAFAKIDGADSQPVSGLLIAGAFGPHPVEIEVTNPGEKPWIDLTLHWLDFLSIPYEREGYTHYRVFGNAKIQNFHYTIPADFSTAIFPIAAALITNSELTLNNLDMSDVQGDKALIPLLKKMGANLHIEGRTLTIKKDSKLKGLTIDANDFIDAVPILAVLGCFAEGQTTITNAAIARRKESDRIRSIVTELKKMGAKIEETPDGLIVQNSQLNGAQLQTYHDHRIILSLSIAALGATSQSLVEGITAAAKTYPRFLADFQSLGASMEIVSI